MKYGFYDKRVLQDRDGVPLIFPKFFHKIEQGYGFASSQKFSDVTGADIFFENPANSGRKAIIVYFRITSLGNLNADLYIDNTVTSSGTPMTKFNLNTGSNVQSAMNVEYGGTYTPGTLVDPEVVPGGVGIHATGDKAEIGEGIILVPGKNLLLRLSSVTSDFSVKVVWWEE